MSTTTAPAPASASEAMDMVHAGLAFLATADAAAMGSAVQATMLRGLEEANSVAVAARISVLGAFAAGQGYTDDGAYSPHTWLMHQTAITSGAAAGHTGWVKRARAHPRVRVQLGARPGDRHPAAPRAAADPALRRVRNGPTGRRGEPGLPAS